MYLPLPKIPRILFPPARNSNGISEFLAGAVNNNNREFVVGCVVVVGWMMV
jgi:hypothetical protein